MCARRRRGPDPEGVAVLLRAALQSDRRRRDRLQGFLLPFPRHANGRRVWQCELSLIDTTLLLAGMLTAAAYFTGAAADESEIRELAESFIAGSTGSGRRTAATRSRKDGNRNAASSITAGRAIARRRSSMFWAWPRRPCPLPPGSFGGWTSTYQWENIFGYDFLYAGPLFIHLFSHAWIDFRGIQRRVHAREGQRLFREQPARGLHPARIRRPQSARLRRLRAELLGHHAPATAPATKSCARAAEIVASLDTPIAGCRYGPDDGTIAPWGMLAALPFSPPSALTAVRHLIERYPGICVGDRMSSGFNPSLIDQRRTGFRKATTASIKASS